MTWKILDTTFGEFFKIQTPKFCANRPVEFYPHGTHFSRFNGGFRKNWQYMAVEPRGSAPPKGNPGSARE